MNNINKNIVQIDPLIELQKEFCFFFLDNQNRVGLLNEIKMMKKGLRIDDISMYKIEDGKFHMRRFLENLPVQTIPKITIEEFMVSPKTKVFNQIAFFRETCFTLRALMRLFSFMNRCSVSNQIGFLRET